MEIGKSMGFKLSTWIFLLLFVVYNTSSLLYVFNNMHKIVSYGISVIEVATEFENFSKLQQIHWQTNH